MDEEHTGGYREPCGQCGLVDWGISDEGKFYCRSCHNVIERTKEVAETSLMIGSNRVSSISKGKRGKKQEHGRQWMVCEGFQFILKHQAEALLAMGVNAQFKDDVLCQFWRKYLQKSRQAYTNKPMRAVQFKVRSRDSESDSAPESVMSDYSMMSASETDGDVDMASTAGHSSGRSSPMYSGSVDVVSYLTPCQRRGHRLMSMPKTLALCYLSLLWAREAITLADLLRFVSEGHIPYVNAYEDFPEEMKLYGRDALIFRVESIPSHRALHKEAQTLAVFLGLPPFPSINQDCLLHPSLLTLRYLTETNLPDELHDWVCRIMHQSGMADESYHTFEPMNSPLQHYDIQAAALIIVAMKLLFKLDDHTEWDLSNDAGDKEKESPDENSFNLTTWYKTVQSALSRARQRQEENTARKHWKSKKPLYPSKKDRSMVLKRRRIAEQLQMSFQKLSGSPTATPLSPPSSFCFRWGEEEGVDGPSLHQQRLDSVVRLRRGTLQPSNPEYWHVALRACQTRTCNSHYEEMEPTLPRSYLWVLGLFSFLMGVKPDCVYEQVLKVERRLLKSRPPPRAGETPRKPTGKQPRKETRKTRSR